MHHGHPLESVVPVHQVTAVVLAGGRGERMGGLDKGLIPLNGRPMVQYVLQALRPQVGQILINANRNQAQYAEFGYDVVPDRVGEYFGPLAGMLSAMRVATTPLILTVPCDSPLVAADLGQRLLGALIREDAEISAAHDGTRLHPVFAALRRDLWSSLEAYLAGGERKIDRWFARHRLAIADFSDCAENFLNVNNPQERAALEARLAGQGAC